MLSAGGGEMHVEVISTVVEIGGRGSGGDIKEISHGRRHGVHVLGAKVSQPLAPWLDRFEAVLSPHTIVIHTWEFWMPGYH